MIKRLLYICLLTVFAFCITACSDSVETDSTDGIPDRANPSVSETESHSEPADRYTVVLMKMKPLTVKPNALQHPTLTRT